MKRMLLTALLVLCMVLWVEGAVLRGRIVLLNSGGKAVANVQVTAFDANPAVSTSSGLFQLDFADKKKPGDVVAIIVQKKGFEVINKKELEHVVLRQNPDELLEIVLCPEGTWEKNAQVYYWIAAKLITDQFDKRLKKIEAEVIEGKDAEIFRLRAELDVALAQAKKLAENFAQVNLDEASDLYKKAFEFYKSGDIKQALKVLDKEKLDAELKKLKEKGTQLAKDYILGARLLIITANFPEAESYYDQALEADAENVDNYLEFTAYLWKQKNFRKGAAICQKALAIKMDEWSKAAFLNNLGLLYSDTTRLTEAEKVYAEALEIRRKLAATNPDAYLPDVAMTLNNLGTLYSDTTRLTEAEKVYAEALEIRRKLAATNPDAYLPDVAMTLNNLGVLYKNTTRLTEAEKVYADALGIYRKLAATNPDAYLPYVAITHNNLGILNINLQKYPDALSQFQETLKIHETFVAKNPQAFELVLCNTILVMTFLYTEAPEACAEIKDEIPSRLERAITILKKYADIPQAQKYLRDAERFKEQIK